jgi:UDP-3-O-[3-hydroxymyristoyl] N-acetylglucosamine deacetylase
MVRLITNFHGVKKVLNISQKTINSKVSCNGVGLHCGENIFINLLPALANTGIIFRRIDVENGKNEIKANYKNVIATSLGTVIANEFGVKVSTIEHLMAAIWGCGIDNLIIEVSGGEIPIMDGSSEPFIFLIECAGINIQEESRRVIKIVKNVRVEDQDKFIEVIPAKEFALDIHIDFNHKQIQKNQLTYNANNNSFKNDLCRARTFCFKNEIDHMHKIGLAKGGSLNNAIVITDDGILNKENLRYDDEFIRHKTLDFIGDMYLAQHYIIGHFKAFKIGHGINNKFLHKLMEDKSSWKLV